MAKASFTIKIKGLNELKRKLRQYPAISRPILADAINKSLFEVKNQAKDKNFQFKTPRSERTGFLEDTFGLPGNKGLILAKPYSLRGKIGPTVKYAPYVHFGTRRGIEPNPFMPRIAKAAESKVQKHFDKALDKIVKKIAK